MTPWPCLDASELFELMPWPDAVTTLEQALREGLDPAAGHARSILDVTGGQLLLMPAEISAGVGVKLGTVTPGNPARGLPRVQALYVLLDPATLSVAALMDGTALTTLRTPSVSAVAVRHLAALDAGRLVVFGSGPQAWGHVQAIAAVRRLTSVSVVGRDRGRADTLVATLRASGLRAQVGTPQTVSDAEIVVCATTAREPLFDGRLLPEDTCVVAVGSHEADARELDDVVLRRAERIVVEDVAGSLREAGDVIMALRSGAVTEHDLIPLRDAVRLAPAPGVSVFKSVGMGWQDLVLAAEAHRRWSGRRLA